jgi:hypothetical protein
MRRAALAGSIALGACNAIADLGSLRYEEASGSVASVASGSSSSKGAGGAGGTAMTSAAASGGAGGVGFATLSSAIASSASSGGGTSKKRVFVTSKSYAGAFGSGKDICNSLATTAGLGGSWTAAISTDKAPGCASGGPWYLVDGKTLVGGCIELASLLKNPIDMNEKGENVGGADQSVWTGITKSGDVGSNCLGWTTKDGSHNAISGHYDQVDSKWRDFQNKPCNETARLYCFEL